MGNYAKAEFNLKNPHKYIGKRPILYRSSWEYTMMKCFDEHPNVLQWSSESLSIPYLNPLTRRWSMYIPDFLVIYVDKNGVKHGEMIEIKPKKEYLREFAKSARDKLAQTINAAKFSAAHGFCKKRGLQFRVATESELFKYKRKS
jgi:hypothetical protein